MLYPAELRARAGLHSEQEGQLSSYVSLTIAPSMATPAASIAPSRAVSLRGRAVDRECQVLLRHQLAHYELSDCIGVRFSLLSEITPFSRR
jgi:hypothetical protein